jgi:glycosyltransferase involved in cell wall biosynthesis
VPSSEEVILSMKFSFVVLTWNRYKFLEKCLQELISSIENHDDSEVIVMDNGSVDKTQEILNSYRHSNLVRVILLKKNYGLNAYKRLFAEGKGEYIVIVDDDVLQFPPKLDLVFADYMRTFPDYGFIALNVVQNQFTNGAKPGPEYYTEETRSGKTIQRGPTGGWCACFRKSEYQKVRLRLMFCNLSMKRSEDGFLAKNFEKKLSLKSGIISDVICFHASGPYYAKQYGHLEREIEKYTKSGLKSLVDEYQKYYEE